MPKDNFSAQARLYASYRPHYPKALYDFIYKHVQHFGTAWDCATGNGQVAGVLSEKFEQVYATDISQNQINNAIQADNIHYSIGRAEDSGLAIKADLITTAQAIHWFNVDAFYKEAKRLAAPEAVLAYWGYSLIRINKTIDPLLDHFYHKVVGQYWDPERKHLDNAYQDIKTPLKDINKENFEHAVAWNIDHLKGYLSSWSSVQHFIRKEGYNPVDELIKELEPHWSEPMQVKFPMFLFVGRI